MEEEKKKKKKVIAQGGREVREQPADSKLWIFYLHIYPAWPIRGTDTQSGHRAHASLYRAFVKIRKGRLSGQMWHMIWQVETRLSFSPDCARCLWEDITYIAVCSTLIMASTDSCLPTVCVRYSIGTGLLTTLTKDLLQDCLRKTWRQTGLAWLQIGSELFNHKSLPSPAKRSPQSPLLSVCHSSWRVVTRSVLKKVEN